MSLPQDNALCGDRSHVRIETFGRGIRPSLSTDDVLAIVCCRGVFRSRVLRPGGSVGSFIGQFLPDYYRVVFGIGRREAFDPVEVGIGLGLNQGWAVGLAVGLVVVGVFAWKDYWLDKVALAVAPHVVRRPERTSALLVLVIVLGIFASVFSGFVGIVLGSFDGHYSALRRIELRQRQALRPILEHPDFAGSRSPSDQMGTRPSRGPLRIRRSSTICTNAWCASLARVTPRG